MTDKRARVPGPDHPITIERNPARVVVVVAGRLVADTCDAVTLREASYAAVRYVPQKDVDVSALERSAHATFSVTPSSLAFATAAFTILCASSEEILCFSITLAIGPS